MKKHLYKKTDSIQQPEKFEWKKKLSAIQHNQYANFAYIFFNLFYTIVICIVFASFAKRRANHKPENVAGFYAVLYEASSVFCNFPMAFIFFDRFGKALKRLFCERETAFLICFALGTVLAGGTTVAGIEIANESEHGFKFIENNPVFSFIALWFSLFNTFSTRAIGSTNLLYASWQGLKKFYYQRHSEDYKPYYLLEDDIEAFGKQADVEIVVGDRDPRETKLLAYASNLYTTISQDIRLENAWIKRLKTLGFCVASISIISIFMVNMMPLWIKLTVKGAKGVSNSFANNSVLVLLAALSNELFYLNSAWEFPKIVMRFLVNINKNISRKFHDKTKARVGSIAALAFFVLLWLVLSYNSGVGYGEDGIEATQYGFGSMANTLWFNWMGWYTNLFLNQYALVTTLAAGSIVNGGAVLNFFFEQGDLALNKFVSFFKGPSWSKVAFFNPPASDSSDYTYQSAAKDLGKMIKENQLDELNAVGVGDLIKIQRDSVGLNYSLWNCCSNRQLSKRTPLSINSSVP